LHWKCQLGTVLYTVSYFTVITVKYSVTITVVRRCAPYYYKYGPYCANCNLAVQLNKLDTYTEIPYTILAISILKSKAPLDFLSCCRLAGILCTSTQPTIAHAHTG
jgi:hypothetical protein